MSGEYSESWREYRRRRAWVLGLLAGWLPYALLIGLLMRSWPGLPLISGVAAVLYLVAFMIALSRWLYWPCPRCQRRFRAQGTFGSRVMASDCAYCQLPFGA